MFRDANHHITVAQGIKRRSGSQGTVAEKISWDKMICHRGGHRHGIRRQKKKGIVSMKRLALAIISILLISCLAAPGYAQSQSQGGIPDPNAPVPPEKAKAIRHLLELTGSAKLGQQMVDQMFAARRATTKQVPHAVWDEIERGFRSEFS